MTSFNAVHKKVEAACLPGSHKTDRVPLTIELQPIAGFLRIAVIVHSPMVLASTGGGHFEHLLEQREHHPP